MSVEEKKFNEQINLATTAVNKLLNIESFRVYCKKEVLKEFDGDYNFLLSKLVKDYGEKINSPVLLSNNLKSNNEYRLEELPQELIDVIIDTYQDYPLTQISIQVDPLAWDPYAYTPNVVYLDATYDESDTDFINGYDVNGSPIQVDARIEPQLPVVILSTNERGYIDASGDYVRYNYFEALPSDNQNIVFGPPLSPIDPNTPIQYYRPNFKYENISAIRYDNLGQIEGWPAGAPETRIFIFEQDLVDSSKTVRRGLGMIEPSRRKDINGKWYTTNIDTHLWRWNKSGTVIKYGFYEEDAQGVSALGDRLVAISNYQVPILDSTKVFVPGTNFPKPNLPSPTQPGWLTILKFTANVVGQIMQKNMEKSETIGELPISVNNERTEYSLAPGGFKFESQPK